MPRRVMIYGATGYTGRLIAAHAANSRCSPVVAGRTADRVRALAAEFGIPGRTVALDETKRFDEALEDVDVLVNAASPFAQTARPLIEACLRTRTHYLDVTGELPVFQDASRYDEPARKRGVMIMPGAGLGIVASDCLAAHVAASIPKPKYLRIGLLRPAMFSRGTFRSALGLSNSQVTIRRNGNLVSLPAARLQRAFDYGEGMRESVAVSWPDVFTAYFSTGIRNIETYLAADFASRAFYQFGSVMADTLRLAPVQRVLDVATRAWPEGPSAEQRQSDKCVIVAEAEDSWRRRVSARLETPDGYSFTAEATTAIARHILRGSFIPGFHTPAQVYGADFVLTLKGTRREQLSATFPDHGFGDMVQPD